MVYYIYYCLHMFSVGKRLTSQAIGGLVYFKINVSYILWGKMELSYLYSGTLVS